MRKFAVVLGAALVCSASLAQVAINEVDYQNPGTDSTEWIELVGKAGTDLTGWQLVLINGNGVSIYGTYALQGTIPNDFTSEWGCDGGFFVVGNFDATTAAVFGAPDFTPAGWPATDALQNGPDDLIQLYDASGTLVDEWQYDSDAPGVNSLTGNSQTFAAFDSAGTAGDILAYSSIGRIGYSFDQPLFVFDNPQGDGSLGNDPFDHNANIPTSWANTPRGPVTEAVDPEIQWSGTLAFGAGRGITPGTFNGVSYGLEGAQDAYSINISCVDPTCDGDLTGDSVVDFADFAALSACFGQPCGDLTGDNITDFADFAVLSADFGCGLP